MVHFHTFGWAMIKKKRFWQNRCRIVFLSALAVVTELGCREPHGRRYLEDQERADRLKARMRKAILRGEPQELSVAHRELCPGLLLDAPAIFTKECLPFAAGIDCTGYVYDPQLTRPDACP